MNAKEAREKSEKIIKYNSDKIIREIQEGIEEEVKKGRFYFNYYHLVNEEVVKYFTDEGFKIEHINDGRGEFSTKFYW